MANLEKRLEGMELLPPVLSCLLTKDKETGRWGGHCLDFDIVTSGLDEDLAWENLKQVVRLHVENCFTHWQLGLKRSASQERWQVFNRLRDPNKPFRQEKIHFDLVAPPLPDEQWMAAFALPEGTDCGHIESVAVQ
jgi:hypothetical protein